MRIYHWVYNTRKEIQNRNRKKGRELREKEERKKLLLTLPISAKHAKTVQREIERAEMDKINHRGCVVTVMSKTASVQRC